MKSSAREFRAGLFCVEKITHPFYCRNIRFIQLILEWMDVS
ncbi:hypothetical protein ADIS_1547 [Lunatimonas lonarensis]|uniref:Uncharacterized protein n=1 Tax=Lunatimonas lonarensis TaxID=1232681 RepID=R7ZVE7_9BACT|nr:hypothetical protein ADIS_1547 [Lunatimonas lonarensis]